MLLGVFLLWTTTEALMQEFDRDTTVFKEQTILELQTGQNLECIKCTALKTIIQQADCLTLKHKKSILDMKIKNIENNMDIAKSLSFCLLSTSAFLLYLVFSHQKKLPTNKKMEHK